MRYSCGLCVVRCWALVGALAGALIFAGLEALQVRAQVLAGAFIPYQFFLMLPYIMSILAMIVIARKTKYPQALLVPFRRGERV